MENTSTAVVFEKPGSMSLRSVQLPASEDGDCIVDVEWTGISTGTERLLWDGSMPPFPGLSYPLVPGYESVGRVAQVTGHSALTPGVRVFVPGSRGFKDVHGLFGGAADRLVVPANRVIPIDDDLGEQAVLFALAATACHIVARSGSQGYPELIIGHGVLGRLVARAVLALGGQAPTVWEVNPARCGDAPDYPVVHPDDDPRSDYRVICDVSGDSGLLDRLIGRAAPGAVVVLGGFYHDRLSFAFPPAFMREISIAVAAEWKPADMSCVTHLLEKGLLSLDGLITHRHPASSAGLAYRTAFNDPSCLKMVLDWRAS